MVQILQFFYQRIIEFNLAAASLCNSLVPPELFSEFVDGTIGFNVTLEVGVVLIEVKLWIYDGDETVRLKENRDVSEANKTEVDIRV